MCSVTEDYAVNANDVDGDAVLKLHNLILIQVSVSLPRSLGQQATLALVHHHLIHLPLVYYSDGAVSLYRNVFPHVIKFS